MKTLNEITKAKDGKTFNEYRMSDLRDFYANLTDDDKKELVERRIKLEEMRENNEDLEVMADGFSAEEYEEFNDMDLNDELMILRDAVEI